MQIFLRKSLVRGVWGLGRLTHIFLAGGVLLLLTYFFGYKLLSGGLVGNDSANSFSFINWLNLYFPKVPLWFPLEGAGVSFVQGYQLLPHLVVVWTHRLSDLSLLQAYELWNFLSVYLSALGLYFWGWLRFRSQTVGLIAGVFFLLAPVTWVWTTQAGFFASSFSLIFVAPSMLFVDRYFDSVFDPKVKDRYRLSFLGSLIFLCLALLSHFTTFMAILIFAVLNYGLYAILKDRNVVINLWRAFLGGVSVFGMSLLVSLFWFVPFYMYNAQTNWDGSSTPNPYLFPEINIDSFLSIPTHIFKVSTVWTFSFPLYVWILALAAIFVGVFYSKRWVIMAVVGAFMLYGSTNIGVYVVVSKISGFLASAFSPRIFWVGYNFISPLLAAVALFYGVNLVFEKIPMIFLKLHKLGLHIFLFLVRSLAIFVSIGVAVILIVAYKGVDLDGASSFAHYGPIFLYPSIYKSYDAGKIYGAGLDLRDVWQKKMLEDLMYVVLIKSDNVNEGMISNLETKSKALYGISFLKNGQRLYGDRDFVVSQVPEGFENLLVINTRNSDRSFQDTNFLSFDLDRDAEVYVAFDTRARVLPGWLSDGFEPMEDKIFLRGSNFDDLSLRIYKRQYQKGKVELGGGTSSPWRGACTSIKEIDKSAKSGFVDTCCYYQIDRGIADRCELAGARVNREDFISQLGFDNWPRPRLGDDNLKADPEVFNNIPFGDEIGRERIDVSPNSFGALLSKLPILRPDLSVLNVYTFQLSLNHVFWALSQGVFYTDKDGGFGDKDRVLADLARYFGVNYVVMGGTDAHYKYKAPEWKVVSDGTGLYTAELLNKEKLYDVNRRPSVLIVGQKKYNPFETLFKSALYGALPFEKGYIVMGEKEKIDDYSLEELENFNAIVLYAYTYNQGGSAWNLLKEYVENGGSVFFDTGWQYVVPDWNLSETPEVFPVEKLKWSNLSIGGKYSLADEMLRQSVDIQKFGPLEWENKSWGVSAASGIRQWAKPALFYEGVPLVVKGELGRGRVVWSGMNLIAHANDKRSSEEILFLGKIFDYLLDGKNIESDYSLNMKRDEPDRVEFLINSEVSENTNFYFREAFSPSWSGYVENNGRVSSLKLYRGGPGLIFTKLPNSPAGSRIVLEYKLLPIEIIAYYVSGVVILGLVIFIFDDWFGKGYLAGRISRSFRALYLKAGALNETKKDIKKDWSSEEQDY